MESAKNTKLFLLTSLLFLFVFLFQLNRHYHSPYPPMAEGLTNSQTNLEDVGGVALGLRRLAADMAWIQTLQYYGTHEEGQSEFDEENGQGKYPLFLAHCQHVVAIDPYFTYAYLYGGASLAWNLGRLSEAEELLKEGIRNNPTEWRIPQYLAGLAYQKNHNLADLTRFLEAITQDPQCPLMMKALLANIYKKQRLFDKALAVWEDIFAVGDDSYKHRAIEQAKEIQKLRKRPS